MVRVKSGARRGLRYGVLMAAAGAAALSVGSDAAVARRHHRIYVHHHHGHAVVAYDPPYSSIVVDGNSGAVLESVKPDAIRHPASLTKVMTLYLLFERLDAGKIKLDTPLTVSAHAADQDPTKLGLKPGQTITVEDAIKGIVTRSANDAAVVIAENLGGSEAAFARMMTQKAHALGMAHTTYVNASGLPDDAQDTTAQDQATLGRAVQERFPRYFKYFSTQSFVFRGVTIRGHDHLLTEVAGVDGIKTGFTRGSGFNLLTSLHRDGRYLVAVVMGGPSAGERDARMRELLADHFKEASLRHTVAPIADTSAGRNEPIAFAKSPLGATAMAARPAAPASTPAADATVHTAAATDQIKPVVVHTIPYRTVPVQTAALAPMPMLVPVAAPAPVAAPRPSAHPAPVAAAPAPRPTVVASAAADVDLRPALQPAPAAAAVPPAPAKVIPAAAAEIRTAPPGAEHAQMAEAERLDSAVPAALVHAHAGWLIQIGAFDDETDAREHLSAAQSKVHGALASKDPFTERVQKGDKALYRARFAGFDEATAKAACRELKRSDFQCITLKD